MESVHREGMKKVVLPGRMLQKAVGPESPIGSSAMSMGFARYSAEYGPMEPHAHAEESIYVISAKDAWALFGPARDQLGNRTELSAGMVLHFPANEWHVFRYAEGGSLDIIFFYGTTANLRPEEK